MQPEQPLELVEPWVITYGEPHGDNSMIGDNGRAHLIDCDSRMVAPRAAMLKLFRAEWHLDEIATKARQFSQAHTDTEDMAVRWRYLNLTCRSTRTGRALGSERQSQLLPQGR